MRVKPDPIRLAYLLDELCAELGFCLPPDKWHRLMNEPPADVEAFTDAVFLAEGMDPSADRHLRRLVRERVGRAFEHAD